MGKLGDTYVVFIKIKIILTFLNWNIFSLGFRTPLLYFTNFSILELFFVTVVFTS